MAGSKSASRGKRKRSGGGTILGFMLGLIVGLGVAVAVAIFVTRAPVPFVNKVGKASERLAEPKSPAEAPDPNKPLYSKGRGGTGSGAPASAPPPQVASAPSSAPGAAPAPAPGSGDTGSVLGNILKGIDPPAGSQPPNRADPKAAPPAAESRPGDPDKASYLLQAGAFRSQDDAEGMKAKLALIGFEARILSADVNGQTLYRVRVGPYAQLDDMNKVRTKLAESGIEASVVRQR